jgi:hypothetical protein
MYPFRCTCNKPFDTQHKLLAHRTNSIPCRRRWEEYVRSFVSVQPTHPAETEDVLMEEADNLPEQGPELGVSASTSHPPIPEDDILDDRDSDYAPLEYGGFDDETTEDSSDGSVDTYPEDPRIPHPLSPPSPPPQDVRQQVPTEPLERSGQLHVETYPSAGSVHTKQPPLFQRASEMHHDLGAGNDYYPFANQTDFELGVWLHESGLSMAKIDEFLSLDYVCTPYRLLPSLAYIHRSRLVSLHLPVPQLCGIGSNSCLTEHLAGRSKTLLQNTVLQLPLSPYFIGTH